MSLYELSNDARRDLDDITAYTAQKYGAKQTLKYMDEIEKTAEELALNRGYCRSLRRVYPKLYSKKCRKHHIFGLIRKDKPMIVIAIFHERMDFIARLKGRL